MTRKKVLANYNFAQVMCPDICVTIKNEFELPGAIGVSFDCYYFL